MSLRRKSRQNSGLVVTHSEDGRRSAAKLLTRDEARRIAEI
jgi:hypothetical protein